MISKHDIERYQQLEATPGFDPAEFFQDEAIDGTEQYQEFGKSGVAIGLVGFLAFAIGGAVAAGAIGLAGIVHIIDRYQRGQKQAQAIRMGDPRAIVGHLPDTYREMYVQHLKDEVQTETQTVTVPVQSVAVPSQSATVRTQSATSAPSNTTPIDVPTVPPAPTRAPDVRDGVENHDPKPVNVSPATTTPNTDIAGAIAALGCRSLFVAGGSGTAKSLIVSTALKQIKRDNPNRQVWIISGKCSGLESGYWSGFDRYSFWDLRRITIDEMMTVFREWLSIIRDFKAYDGEGILLIDELSLILMTADQIARSIKNDSITKTFINELVMLLIGLSSAGRSENKGVWAIAPMGAINGLPGLSKAKMNAFIKLFLAQLPDSLPPFDFGIWRDASANGIAPQEPPSLSDIQRAKRLGCTLLCGFQNDWIPVMRYDLPAPDRAIITQFNKPSEPPQQTERPSDDPSTTIQLPLKDHPTTTQGSSDDHAFDLEDYEQRYSVVHITTTRDGIRDGLSKNKIIKSLRISAGTSRAYKDWLLLYEHLASRQPARQVVGVAHA